LTGLQNDYLKLRYPWHPILQVALAVLVMENYWIKPLTSSWQGTLGKKLVGIKVINESGVTLTTQQAASRFFLSLVSIILLGIGYLMPLWTQKKQALHDMIMKTVVIRK
jgi:uncharacterized RDD family membrane protein YckC